MASRLSHRTAVLSDLYGKRVKQMRPERLWRVYSQVTSQAGSRRRRRVRHMAKAK